MNALSTLARLLGGSRAQHPDDGRTAALETHVRALYDHVEQLRRDAHALERGHQQLRQDEARRAAEHAAMVDQLNRLYRRMAARIAREAEHPLTPPSDSDGESVAAFKRRLGR